MSLDLEELNRQLESASPQEIIAWALKEAPGLYQTTALGLSGLVILDMTEKLAPATIELVFIDTLHHFKETLELLERVKARYPNTALHIYRPEGAETEQEFAEKYGAKLWEGNELFYDYLVKVDPADRAYKALGIKSVFTGRRRTQGAARSDLKVLELTDSGLLKINPLVNWSFEQVKAYIDKEKLPYNVLLDQGYRSVGDYHSTEPVKDGEDERAGRWKGKAKTECGIHDTARFASLKQPT